MTEKEKKLLLKDLSARLPYGVICQVQVNDVPQPLVLVEIGMPSYGTFMTSFVAAVKHIKNIDEVKPYLRPMSSMTKEEESEYIRLYHECGIAEAIDLLNSHHLDHRCLIEKGLALEMSSEMYKNENVV